VTGRPRRVVAVAVVLAALVGPVGVRAAPAGAQQVRLEAAKKVASAAITRRVLALRQLTTAAKSIVRLSDADRSALTTQLQDQVNGLSSLNAKVQGDTDEATVRADAGRIVTDYRVYVLTIPKARGVVVSDIELIAADRLTKLADRLSNAIEQATGKDTTKAKTDLASLRTKVGAATSTVTPLPAALLGLQPAGYPANHTTLEQARASLRTGRAALAEGATVARQVIADLAG
jgi:type II secretory pathway pseudopilin PulG